MAYDAPPRRELPKLIDLQSRSRPNARPQLIPLAGPRRQSTTIIISLRALTFTLVLPLVLVALANSSLGSPLSAQLVRWYSSSLLLLCAIGLTVVGKRPQEDQRRYLLGAIAVLALSFCEAAPHDTWPRFSALLASLHYYPFLTLVAGLTVACSVLALAARRSGTIRFAPAVVVYLIGLLAGLLSSDHQPEHPLTGLLRSVANLGRMLGPVLAVRAMLQYLSPPERPAALRFALASTTGSR